MSSDSKPLPPRNKDFFIEWSSLDEHPVCDKNGYMCQACKEQEQYEELKQLEKQLMEEEDCEEITKQFSSMNVLPHKEAEAPEDNASRVGIRNRNLKTLGYMYRDRSPTGRTKQAIVKHKKIQKSIPYSAKAELFVMKLLSEITTQDPVIALNDGRCTTTCYKVKNLSDAVNKMDLH